MLIIRLNEWYWHPRYGEVQTHKFFGPFVQVRWETLWVRHGAEIWKCRWVLKRKLKSLKDIYGGI